MLNTIANLRPCQIVEHEGNIVVVRASHKARVPQSRSTEIILIAWLLVTGPGLNIYEYVLLVLRPRQSLELVLA